MKLFYQNIEVDGETMSSFELRARYFELVLFLEQLASMDVEPWSIDTVREIVYDARDLLNNK